MGALIGWLLSAFGTAVGYSALRFVAWKLVVWTIVVTILPIIFTNVIYSIIDGAMQLSSQAQSQYSVSGYIMSLTGLAAWLAIQLRLPESVAVIMSAVMFRIAIRMIPFVRL